MASIIVENLVLDAWRSMVSKAGGIGDVKTLEYVAAEVPQLVGRAAVLKAIAEEVDAKSHPAALRKAAGDDILKGLGIREIAPGGIPVPLEQPGHLKRLESNLAKTAKTEELRAAEAAQGEAEDALRKAQGALGAATNPAASAQARTKLAGVSDALLAARKRTEAVRRELAALG